MIVKGLIILATAIVLSVFGSVTYFRYATAQTKFLFHQPAGELEWLRQEFQLDESQFARIRVKHEEYAPKCERMCAEASKLDRELIVMFQNNKKVTPELEAALKRWADVEAECRRVMLNHVYAVSAEMSPAQGARYLAMMESRLLQHDHDHHLPAHDK